MQSPAHRTNTDTTGAADDIRLLFDFIHAAVADSDVLDVIPDGAGLILLPDDDPELAATEIEAGIAAVRHGYNVYFVHIHHEPDGSITIKPSPSPSRHESIPATRA